MDDSIQHSQALEETILRNSEYRAEPEIAAALDSRVALHRRTLALRNQPDLDADARKKLMKAQCDVFEGSTGPIGLEIARLSAALQEIAVEKNGRIAAGLEDRIRQWRELANADLRLPPLPSPPPSGRVPQPSDHSFWWAFSWGLHPFGMSASFEDDGLHFGGAVQVKTSGEIRTSFGVVACFELQPNRMRPPGPNGQFLSSPQVELSGTLASYTPSWPYDPFVTPSRAASGLWPVFLERSFVSCDLVLKQTVYQWGFGGTGRRIVAEAYVSESLIHERSSGRTRLVPMPGYKLLPFVSFNRSQFNAHESLWAEIEVRFEIELEAFLSGVWCQDKVVLRTIQWPLIHG